MIEDGDSKKNRKLTPSETKAKVKFDRQVIAIAIANRAEALYTGDTTLAKHAGENGVKAVLTWEVPLPAMSPQLNLNYEADGTDR